MTAARTIRRWTLALVAAVAAVGLLRTLAVAPFRLPDGSLVFVNRWSYGLRLPLPSLAGYARWLPEPMEKGDQVAFDNPLEAGSLEFRQVFVGRCSAAPGDTLHLPLGAWRIPRRGEYAEVTEASKLILQEALLRYERLQAVVGSDGRLYVEGRPARKVRLTRDYYWMQTADPDRLIDSRTFGLIPMELVIGRIIR